MGAAHSATASGGAVGPHAAADSITAVAAQRNAPTAAMDCEDTGDTASPRDFRSTVDDNELQIEDAIQKEKLAAILDLEEVCAMYRELRSCVDYQQHLHIPVENTPAIAAEQTHAGGGAAIDGTDADSGRHLCTRRRIKMCLVLFTIAAIAVGAAVAVAVASW
jgi:hypothetical protein